MEQHRPEPFGPPRVFTGQGESLPEPSVPPESPVGGWPVGSGPAESQVVRSESQPVGFGPVESQAVGSESQPVGSESQPIGIQPAEMLIPAPCLRSTLRISLKELQGLMVARCLIRVPVLTAVPGWSFLSV